MTVQLVKGDCVAVWVFGGPADRLPDVFVFGDVEVKAAERLSGDVESFRLGLAVSTVREVSSV